MVLPEKLKVIEFETFDGCENLKYVYLGNVEILKNDAFSRCNNITEITMPNSITQIGENFFEETEWFKRLPINPYGLKCYKHILFKSTDREENIIISDDITVIAGGAFQDSTNLKTIVLPKGLKSIGNAAFADCINLEDIFIPEGIEYIGSLAFSDCKSLTEISIPESINNIANYTFESCEKLKRVDLPKKLENIGEGAFSDCIELKRIVIPSQVKQIESAAFFDCINLEDIKFEGSPEYIGRAFQNTKFYNNIREDEYGCKYVSNHLIEALDKERREIIIKEGTVSIANYAFYQSKIDGVVFPKGLEIIGYLAFGECNNLKNVEFPEGVTYIGYRCFFSCKNLKKVYMPKSIEDVGSEIFLNCKKLKEVTVSKTIADSIEFYENVKLIYIE